MAGSTSRTHTIICWNCFFPFEVKLALPKNAKKQGRVYNPWKSARKCTACNSKTVLKLSYTEKTGVYVDYEEPVEELDDMDGKDLAPIDQIGTYFSRNYREGERLKLPKGTAKGAKGLNRRPEEAQRDPKGSPRAPKGVHTVPSRLPEDLQNRPK